jgi:hypothetical protein
VEVELAWNVGRTVVELEYMSVFEQVASVTLHICNLAATAEQVDGPDERKAIKERFTNSLLYQLRRIVMRCPGCCVSV